MLKWFNKKKKDNKGFTLVELVIVVAILAILVGLLAPQYTKYVEKSRQSADVDNVEEMVKAIQVALADTDGIYSFTKGTDTMVISKTKGTAVSVSGTNAIYIEKALDDYLGAGYDDIYLKSSAWSGNVTVTLDVDENLTLDVKYSPGNFATAIGGSVS